MSKTIKIMPTQVKRTDGTWLGGETLGYPGEFSVTRQTVKDWGFAEQNEVDFVKSEIGMYNPNPSIVAGYYITNNSEIKASGSFSHTEPFPLKKGDVVNVTATGYSTNVAMIASCEDAVMTGLKKEVLSVDSQEHEYTYTATRNMYAIVSFDSRKNLKIEVIGGQINSRLKAEIDSLTSDVGISQTDWIVATIEQAGKYVNQSGGISNSSNFNIFSPISLKSGDKLVFNAKGYLTNVSVLSHVMGDEYTPLIISSDSDEHTFEYIADDNMTVAFSCIRTVTPVYAVTSNSMRGATFDMKRFDIFPFVSLGVVGDSLASGASNYPKPDGSSTGSDNKNYSWGKYIEREHGVQVALYSQGGTDTRTWFTRDACYGEFNRDTAKDAYAIGLGVNDEYLYGESYLGSASDVHVGTESSNADTFYGNYSKIIAALRAKSPYCKIFVFTNPRAITDAKRRYNEAVRNIATMYDNVFVLDCENEEFYQSAEISNYWYSAHSTAIGYKLMSGQIWRMMNAVIRQNYKKFLDVQWAL